MSGVLVRVRCRVARTNDAPYPVAQQMHPECDLHGLHVAISVFISEADPSLAFWDTALWDDATAGKGWVGTTKWIDIAGDVQGLTIRRPENEDLGIPGTAELTMQLSNANGQYTQFSGLGQIDNLAVGGQIAVWFDDGNRDAWQFAGRIAVWEEDYGIAPTAKARGMLSSVTVTAYD